MRSSRLPSLAFVLTLSGCATMTPDECRVADWYLIGELDARAGRAPAHFAQRDRDCREAGFPADQASWREGWDHGLTIFCTADQGFRFGRDGGRYESICPATLERDFVSGFDLGRQLSSLTESVSGIRGEITTLDAKIREGRRSGNLDEKQLSGLQSERSALLVRLRAAELELAEATGLARGRGLL